MIDSHCHLTDPRLGAQLDAVLARAAAANVTHLVTIGTDPDDAAEAIAVCEKHPVRVRCAVGIHPNYCQNVELSAVERIRELSAHPSVVALGEMGLDYHYDFAEPSRQKRFFEAQLNLAAELGRPVVIHCREAVSDALDILKGYPSVRCVFHCFTGTVDEAVRIVNAGYLLGFTGPITFKKNDALRECVRQTPLDRILVETDAPYLSPEPVRSQKTCEPAFVAHTLAMVAKVKGLLIDEVDRATAENTRRFYQMD